jgi:hypothetical protein
MPKLIITAQFADTANSFPYEMDIGNKISASGRFILPPDLDLAQAATILELIGAKPLSLITKNGFCSDSSNGKLRRLIFVRSDGSSMSVPVANRNAGEGIIGIASGIKGVLDSGAIKTSCIKLVGEYWRNLNSELSVPGTAGQVATSHRANSGATKQHYYTGRIQYETDATKTAGNTVLLPIKSISDIQGAPASQISSVWSQCVGTLSQAKSCTSSRDRYHRRFLLNFATKIENGLITETESIELPHREASSTSIKACGLAAAQLQGLQCIGYRGESYNKFHKVL